MKTLKSFIYIFIFILAVILISEAALADDGQMFRRNISRTPDGQTSFSAISMMQFYVPAQNTKGEQITIVYTDTLGAEFDSRDFAKPLISVYIDEAGEEDLIDLGGYELNTGVGFGYRDAFAALSLDDGATWKKYNLSRSADRSSFTLKNGHDYPGDVHWMKMAVAGDRVLAVWLSKYCESGSPLYAYSEDELKALASDNYPDHFTDPISDTTTSLYLPYLPGDGEDARDLFGVAGNQLSVDYTLQGFPEVGEIPYSCLWASRGKLVEVENDDGTTSYDLLWTKGERLTSGRRDANRVEVAGAAGAGFVLTWQEDPEGLRPGKGLGPGEGWSGAIVNQKTDIWYSYIGWEHFDDVCATWNDDDGFCTEIVKMDSYEGSTLDGETEETLPKSIMPFHIPIRLSDNGMCKQLAQLDQTGGLINAYCYADYDLVAQEYLVPEASIGLDMAGSGEFCAEGVDWVNPGGTPLKLCKTSDGRVLWGRTGAARTRVELQGYDTDGDGLNDSAWVIVAYEELKALGDQVDPITGEPLDVGKNVWYHSFDMFHPDIVAQGGMLNQPAVCTPDAVSDGLCADGEFMPMIDPDDTLDPWGGMPFYQTEIGRRFNVMSQPYSKIGTTGTSAILIYKQGIINQGGPADIYLRPLVLPDTFDPAVDNPYDYHNMLCSADMDGDGNPDDAWQFTGTITNPHYVEGLCLAPAINISGNTIVSCDDGTAGDECALQFPWTTEDAEQQDFRKVIEWRQCDGSDPSTIEGCGSDNDLDDQSWENPYDVAKGHRGFIDGDIVMMMYAWTPNWKANAVGNDHFNLFVRRSFDGGLTWTTTPMDLGGLGTSHTQWYGLGENVISTTYTYAAGAFEQARNVSELVGNKVTVLDPRYTPTPATITPTLGVSQYLTDTYLYGLYPDDTRDPSHFFVIYETGDNSVVDEETAAVPLDLFYSRADTYGDTYDYIDYYDEDGNVIKSAWDWLENQQEDLSGEASVVTNPGGTFFYGVWNQWQEPEPDLIENSDSFFRRVLYIDNFDAAPVGGLLYKSHESVLKINGGELTFVGTGKDSDHFGGGIVAFEWLSSLDGVLSTDKIFSAPVDTLSNGVHIISFSVQDAEGNWSYPIRIKLSVADEYFTTSLPILAK